MNWPRRLSDLRPTDNEPGLGSSKLTSDQAQFRSRSKRIVQATFQRGCYNLSKVSKVLAQASREMSVVRADLLISALVGARRSHIFPLSPFRPTLIREKYRNRPSTQLNYRNDVCVLSISLPIGRQANIERDQARPRKTPTRGAPFQRSRCQSARLAFRV